VGSLCPDFLLQHPCHFRLRLTLGRVTACAYTSSVILIVACRSSSCTVLMSSPFAFSKVEKVRRKVLSDVLQNLRPLHTGTDLTLQK
jgi:hypothetical protein